MTQQPAQPGVNATQQPAPALEDVPVVASSPHTEVVEPAPQVTPFYEELDHDSTHSATHSEEQWEVEDQLTSEERDPQLSAATRYEIFSMTDHERTVTAATHLAPTSTSHPIEEEDDAGDEPPAPSLPTLDLAQDGRQETWRKLVAHIRLNNAPLAATLEHAYIEEFTSGKITMGFAQRYSMFIHDERRIKPLRDLLAALFGPDFTSHISARFDETPLPGFETLAQLRDAELRARRDKLADDTEQHPTVRLAIELFKPEATRVMIALHED